MYTIKIFDDKGRQISEYEMNEFAIIREDGKFVTSNNKSLQAFLQAGLPPEIKEMLGELLGQQDQDTDTEIEKNKNNEKLSEEKKKAIQFNISKAKREITNTTIDDFLK